MYCTYYIHPQINRNRQTPSLNYTHLHTHTYTNTQESADGSFVLRTIPRDRLWEIQTPQVVKPKLLAEAFAFVKANNLEVTDDVSMVEQIGKPVKLTMGEYTNIKLTTPEDLGVAEGFLKQRAEGKI